MARKSRKGIDENTNTVATATKKPVFRVGAYIRMSVEDRKQIGNSIENQQSLIKDYVADYADLEIVETYIDNGISGQTLERPAFTKMIDDLGSGKINCCITKDLSRLGRSAIDTGYYVEKFFPAKNIRYIAITDNYDSSDPKSGGIMLSLKNMINEAYALEVSRKVKDTIRRNIRNGCFIGGIAPYGYLKHENDCHKLVIDTYASGIVRTMFEMAADGQSHGAILTWLNDNDIIPPMRYLHSIGRTTAKAKGAKTQWWSLRAVRDILRNRMYCGDMIQGRSRIEGGVQIKLPESEWTITENTHEAIVSREVFAEVQKFWDKPKVEKEPYYKGENREDIFRGKLYCGDCGTLILRKRTGNNTYSYLCPKRSHYTKRACNGMRTTEPIIKNAVFTQIVINGFNVFPKADALKDLPLDSEKYKSELIKVKSDTDKNSRYLIGLYESLKCGDINETEYRELKGTYELRMASLAEQENNLQDLLKSSIRKEKALEIARNSTKSVKTVADLTTDVIDQTIEKVIIHGRENFEIIIRNFGEDTVGGVGNE